MAKYMTLSKPQVMAIRNVIMPVGSPNRGSMNRSTVRYALTQSTVAEMPDQDVLDKLFTMWDVTGCGTVSIAEFVVGISILACKEDSFEQAIRFALQVADRTRSGKISSKDASIFLQSKFTRTLLSWEKVSCSQSTWNAFNSYFSGICTTASYFGDKLLDMRQIYKLVDSIFETMTLISQDADELTHDAFVTLLAEQRLVHDLVVVRPRAAAASATIHPSRLRPMQRNLFRVPEKFPRDSSRETDAHSLGKNSLKANSEDSAEIKPAPTEEYCTDVDSHMSSVMLTPLAKLAISATPPAEHVKQTPTDCSSHVSSSRLIPLNKIRISTHSTTDLLPLQRSSNSSHTGSVGLRPLTTMAV
jgi:Ca2+-binding EF-hand superfamily protein